MKKTYSYQVIESRPIKIDYDRIFDYIKTDILFTIIFVIILKNVF